MALQHIRLLSSLEKNSFPTGVETVDLYPEMMYSLPAEREDLPDLLAFAKAAKFALGSRRFKEAYLEPYINKSLILKILWYDYPEHLQ